MSKQEQIAKIKAGLTLDDHPTKDIVAAAPGVEGIEVTRWPWWKLIRLNKIGIGYFSLKSGGISFHQKQHEYVVEAVEAFCKEEAKKLGSDVDVVSSMPPVVPRTEDYDDE